MSSFQINDSDLAGQDFKGKVTIITGNFTCVQLDFEMQLTD